MNRISILALKFAKKIYTKLRSDYQLPPLQREEDPDKISNMVFKLLSNKNPCMIARYGSTELTAITNYIGVTSTEHSAWKYIKGAQLEWWWNKKIIKQMQEWSGFFPPTEEAICKFSELMIEDIKQIDILGSWLRNEPYVDIYNNSLHKIWLIFLDPFWSKSPWTKALKGKKILVVHPFAELIESQYKNNRKHLFQHPDILPEFELQTIKAVQSLGGESNGYQDWFSALDYMKAQIDKTDFDICLLGCGAYGLPLAAHIKRKGKKAVHMGGSLQLLFGIIGKRWENPDYAIKAQEICPHLNYPKLINSYWIRPSEYKSKNSENVENNCYW